MRAIRAGAEPPISVDKRYLRKGGGEVWVRRSAAVVRDSAGGARYLVGAVVDLTEQRKKDRSLQPDERVPARHRGGLAGRDLRHGPGRAGHVLESGRGAHLRLHAASRRSAASPRSCPTRKREESRVIDAARAGRRASWTGCRSSAAAPTARPS